MTQITSNLSINTIRRTLDHVKASKSGILQTFEDGAKSYKGVLGNILDALWSVFSDTPRTKEQDQHKENLGHNLFSTIKENRNATEIVLNITADGSKPQNHYDRPIAWLRLKTEHGSIYYYTHN